MYAVLYTLFPVIRHQDDAIKVGENLCYVDFERPYICMFVVINLFVPLAVIILLNFRILKIANKHTIQIRSFHRVRGSNHKSISETRLLDRKKATSNTEHGINGSREGFWQSFVSSKRKHVKFSAGKEKRKISDGIRRSNGSQSSSEHGSVNESRPAISRQRSFTTTFVCNIKAAKRIALLVGECVFCWLFYIVVICINISGDWKDPKWNPILTKVGMMINCSTLFLNPLVTGILNPKVRKVVFSFLSRIFTRELRRNVTTSSSTSSYS